MLAFSYLSAAQPPAHQPPWLAPVQAGFQQQNEGKWAEAAASYTTALASGLPAQHAVAVRSNLGLSLENLGARLPSASAAAQVLALRLHEVQTRANAEYHRTGVHQADDLHARGLLQSKVPAAGAEFRRLPKMNGKWTGGKCFALSRECRSR